MAQKVNKNLKLFNPFQYTNVPIMYSIIMSL